MPYIGDRVRHTDESKPPCHKNIHSQIPDTMDHQTRHTASHTERMETNDRKRPPHKPEDGTKYATGAQKNKTANGWIDADYAHRMVSYRPGQAADGDTPVCKHLKEFGERYALDVTARAIFGRPAGGNTDGGNPLVCALRDEQGWRFASERDREAIFRQISSVAGPMLDGPQQPRTVIFPLNGPLNGLVRELAERKQREIRAIDDRMPALEVEEVRELLLLPDSGWRKQFETPERFYDALNKFDEASKRMTDGIFRIRRLEDPELRSAIEQTLKTADLDAYQYMEAIDGQDVLVLDIHPDMGASIRDTCEEILSSYAPRSITLLTLFPEE